jgi:hypothetical protein
MKMDLFYHRKTYHGVTSKDVMKKGVEEVKDGKSIQVAKDYLVTYHTHR